MNPTSIALLGTILGLGLFGGKLGKKLGEMNQRNAAIPTPTKAPPLPFKESLLGRIVTGQSLSEYNPPNTPTRAPTIQPTVQPTVTPTPKVISEYQHKIPYQTRNGTGNVPTGIAQDIFNVWTSGKIGPPGDATAAASMLHHAPEAQVKGYGMGENTGFQTTLDVPNRIDENGNWDDNAPIQTFQSPFPSLGTLQSIDRGLFRINNKSFLNFLSGKEERQKMYEAGIIDNPHLDWEGLTPEVIHKYWNYMNDPIKNIKMAKIIFDKQGYGAWFAAPARLLKSGY